MPDRIAHDHATVETIDATIGRHGGTTRPEIRIDGDLEVDAGSLIRVVLDDQEYRAQVEHSTSNTAILRHAAKSPDAARNPGAGSNALQRWVENTGLEFGQTVHLDVVEPGFRYGVRAPGEEAVYKTGRPDESLAAIAKQLDPEQQDRKQR